MFKSKHKQLLEENQCLKRQLEDLKKQNVCLLSEKVSLSARIKESEESEASCWYALGGYIKTVIKLEKEIRELKEKKIECPILKLYTKN